MKEFHDRTLNLVMATTVLRAAVRAFRREEEFQSSRSAKKKRDRSDEVVIFLNRTFRIWFLVTISTAILFLCLEVLLFPFHRQSATTAIPSRRILQGVKVFSFHLLFQTG